MKVEASGSTLPPAGIEHPLAQREERDPQLKLTYAGIRRDIVPNAYQFINPLRWFQRARNLRAKYYFELAEQQREEDEAQTRHVGEYYSDEVEAQRQRLEEYQAFLEQEYLSAIAEICANMAANAARGKKAMDASRYEEAIKEYSDAIAESPTSPDFYIQRSVANQRAGHFEAALADAEQGVLNAMQRAKKELITEAQFRRGVALYKLGRLGDAGFILNVVKQRDEKHKQAEMWINKTKMDVEKLNSDDDKLKVTIVERPSMPAARPAEMSPSPSPPAAPQQTPADKIRYDWYQNTENIYFTVMAKNVPKDQCVVHFEERSFSVSFPTASNSSYDLHFEPLFAPIDPNRSITRVLASKVEIILIKAQPGVKWRQLESDDPKDAPKANSVAGGDQKADDAVKRAVLTEPAKGPAYPTSSKKGPKDWDKVAKEAMPKSDKHGAAEDDDDYEGGDAANHFFKKLFKGASPEAQRAMMKSYTESNGTALSTNWEEVSKGLVETTPPDGMEAKPWK
ncbi:hypothetical protein BST61_g5535 [Cercospora zeina]